MFSSSCPQNASLKWFHVIQLIGIKRVHVKDRFKWRRDKGKDKAVEKVGHKKKQKKPEKRKEKQEWIKEKGGLKETWDFIQSHRLFAAMMFNYFQGLGIRGVGENSHLYELDTRQKLRNIWWCATILSVSLLNDLNLTLSSTKCDDTIPVYWKKEIKEEKRWGKRRRRGQTNWWKSRVTGVKPKAES